MLHVRFHDHRTISSGRRRFLRFFTISWSCDQDHFPPSQGFDFDWPSGFREEDVIHMYIAPVQGQTTPWGQMYSLTH